MQSPANNHYYLRDSNWNQETKTKSFSRFYLQPGVTHVIYAYHSLGPDSMITLDSLTPEHLGGKSFTLIPENGTVDEKAYNVSCNHYNIAELNYYMKLVVLHLVFKS